MKDWRERGGGEGEGKENFLKVESVYIERESPRRRGRRLYKQTMQARNVPRGISARKVNLGETGKDFALVCICTDGWMHAKTAIPARYANGL